MTASLLRIELRRTAAPLVLPLMALLVVLSPAWRHLGTLPLWPQRSDDLQIALQGAAPLFAGTAAWMAGREHRRGMADLLATTPRSAWARLLTTWAATALWGLLFYLVLVAVLLGITARQAAWGAPVPWPPLEGALAMLTCATLGFALGHHLPSRFTPPLVGVGVFAALGVGITLVNHRDKIGYLVALTYPSVAPGDSLWYADRPDLGLVQAIFLLGVVGAGLGSLAVTARRHAAPWRTRVSARVLGVIGLALIGASVALISSSTVVNGMVRVPLFGGPAANTPLAYSPACVAAPLPVCVHPAYRPQLAETTRLINRIAAPVLGLPGAPVRAEQRPATTAVVSAGTVPALVFTPIDLHDPTAPPQSVQAWLGQIAASLVADRLNASGRPWTADRAQSALALYLLRNAGVSVGPVEFAQGPDITAAKARFAGLPTQQRRAWLRTHYLLLRRGLIQVRDIP